MRTLALAALVVGAKAFLVPATRPRLAALRMEAPVGDDAPAEAAAPTYKIYDLPSDKPASDDEEEKVVDPAAEEVPARRAGFFGAASDARSGGGRAFVDADQ